MEKEIRKDVNYRELDIECCSTCKFFDTRDWDSWQGCKNINIWVDVLGLRDLYKRNTD